MPVRPLPAPRVGLLRSSDPTQVRLYWDREAALTAPAGSAALLYERPDYGLSANKVLAHVETHRRPGVVGRSSLPPCSDVAFTPASKVPCGHAVGFWAGVRTVVLSDSPL